MNYYSPIYAIDSLDNSNNIFIMREDLIPFSFGGNKARKAVYFFKEIIEGDYTTVVTYGSKSSNHCRIITNLCSKYNLKCVIISPISEDSSNYNRKLVNLTETEIVECKVEDVSTTIENTLKNRASYGEKVYFIPGGGHGNYGTQAYVDAYNEINKWEVLNSLNFDYIFIASGTGTTQAGLIAGQLLHNDLNKQIVGISIARSKPRGTSVITKSLEDYFKSINIKFNITLTQFINFTDKYISDGYGKSNEQIQKTVKYMYLKNGTPMSETYTGKAYFGMEEYIKAKSIRNKNILFINTGGVPLFFNNLEKN